MAATITEDEAALYDRQIRLWGLDAQQKMRNATVMVIRLRGVATEAIKNIVLAGIGKLIVIDDSLVQPEDVFTGFFFREEDVNVKRRIDAAKPHIQSLNPLVTVEVSHNLSALTSEEALGNMLQGVDLVCLTDMDQATAIRVNDAARKLGKKFYCAGSFGLSGYIFCDLVDHQHVAAPRVATKDNNQSKLEQFKTSYVPLSKALLHSWKDTTSNATKVLRPLTVFAILACWEYQTQYGSPPSSEESCGELETIANRLLKRAQVRQKVCTSIPREAVEYLSTTAAREWTPSCAVIGGMLGQDVLKALAAREPPMANFFFFDGPTCNGTVVRMAMPEGRLPGPTLPTAVAQSTILEID